MLRPLGVSTNDMLCHVQNSGNIDPFTPPLIPLPNTCRLGGNILVGPIPIFYSILYL